MLYRVGKVPPFPDLSEYCESTRQERNHNLTLYNDPLGATSQVAVDRILGCNTVDRILGCDTVDRILGCDTVDRILGCDPWLQGS